MLNYRDIRTGTSPVFSQLYSLRNSVNSRNVSRASTSPNLMFIPALLCHFNKVWLTAQHFQITRSDLPSYTINYVKTVRNTMAPETYELNDMESILQLRFVNVKAQITQTFETDLRAQYTAEEGWTEYNAVSLALKHTPRHRIRVYVKDDTVTNEDGVNILSRRVHIYSANLLYDSDNDYAFFRKILATIPLLLSTESNNYVQEHPDFANVFRNLLTTADANAWLNEVLNYLNTIDSFKQIQTLELRTALTRLSQARINNLRRELDDTQSSIEGLKNELANKLNVLRNIQYSIAYNTDGLSEEDITFLINKNIIQNLKVENGIVYFNCEAPVLSYNKDEARTYYNNRLKNDSSAFSKLFKACFIDERFVLFFTDCLTIYTTNIDFSARGSSWTHHHNTAVIPNPHHYYYNCWGNYESTILELISKYNYMQLFMQIKTAVGSLNMVDYTVLDRFYNYINEVGRTSDIPCVDWKDGTGKHTIKETLIKIQEESTNETN